MPEITNFEPLVAYSTVTVAQSGTTSSSIDLMGTSLVGILTPSAITSASLALQGSADGTNFFPLYNALNVAVSISVSANRYYAIDPVLTAGIRFLRLGCSSEAAAREITLISRRIL